MKSKLKFLIVFYLMLSFTAFSQAPNSFKYQSMLRKADGSALANQPVKVKISILKGSTSGTSVYSENHSVTSNAFGVLNFNIGEGADKSGSISTIDWSVDSYYVKIEIDETGGSNYSLSGVSQLLSVPYALNANSVKSVDWSKVQNKPNIFSGNYDDLTNKPDFKNIDNDSTNELQSLKLSKNYLSISKGNVIDLSDIPLIVKSADGQRWQIIVDSLGNITTQKADFVIDIEGNSYKTVKIGNQTWMAENLKVSHFQNGDEISDGTGLTVIPDINMSKYCFMFNDSSQYSEIYGKLYTGYTILDSRNVCPMGWRVPTNSDWSLLENYLGGGNQVGWKLKESGNAHWPINTKSTNETGFTALPTGFKQGADGSFWHLATTPSAYLWSISEGAENQSVFVLSYSDWMDTYMSTKSRNDACGVRCIKE